MDIYAKAEDELNSIDQQVAALQKRQAELRQFVNLGKSLFAGKYVLGLVPAHQDSYVPPNVGLVPPGNVRTNTTKSRILEISEEFVRQHGATPTRTLVAAIEAQGIEIKGADKVLTVSVILSRSERFKADRKFGWTLIEKQNPQDVATSAGLPVADAT